MNQRTPLGRNTTTVAAILPLALIALPILYSATDTLFAQEPEVFLELPEGQEHCVRDTEYMRFHHMDLLLEIRDQVQRDGKRTQDVGFTACVPPEGQTSCYLCQDCHSNRAEFCNRCHNAVDLVPDCFGCHYYPETPDREEER
jgi:hypothetical protein